MRPSIPSFVAGLALAVTAIAMQSPLQAAEVNLYSSRHYEVDEQLYKQFTKETGIKVNVVQAGGSELIQRIQREGRNSPADVFLTADAGIIGQAQIHDLLQPVKSATLEKIIPPNLREPEGYWFGFTMRARVIVYNKDKTNPAQLSTYEDLADPKWKGKILIRSSNSSYNQSLTAAMIAAHGAEKTEQWAKGIVANLARPPQGGDRDQVTAMLAGEGELAISNTYYLGHLVEAKTKDMDKVGVFFPNQNDRGTHVNISGGGITRYAPNKDNAIKFLEFLTTPEAQKVFADGNYEYPVRAEVPIPAVIAKYGTDFKHDQLNVSALAKYNAEAVRVLDRAGWQ